MIIYGCRDIVILKIHEIYTTDRTYTGQVVFLIC